MADGEQMNPVLLHIESINNSVVADASAETVRAFQPMMWKRFEAQSDFINFCFNSLAKSGWKPEEYSVKASVIDLSRRAHEPLGSRTRALFPSAMSRSAC